MHNKHLIIIYYVQEDLLQIDEYLSDTKSIYSIISIPDPDYNFGHESDDNEEFTSDFLHKRSKVGSSYLTR